MKPNVLFKNSEGSELDVQIRPLFFRLTDVAERQQLKDLIARENPLVHDTIYDQLKELLKSRNPAIVFTPSDFEERIAAHVGDLSPEEYGVWVYYPWSRRLVHLLDESEFIELRTSANRNKITVGERDLLAGKKVGVIGLSVGQSVSVTLALERGCGELRLADFDTLELNNLNRIRTGVHNLGLLKAVSVAREIAEIDPYFKVVCFTSGVTEENIHAFLTENGKLDLLIDECDSVNIKILCRVKAKEQQIPVLMEASDRGTLDVERFDLHPERPIMHGWLEHLTLDFEILRNLKTNEEKVPYMLPISGLETLSDRMRASMIELRSTISTWPQLATAVTLGGAIAADTCRRVFLNQFTDSGRYFIDMEALIPEQKVLKNEIPVANDILSLAEMELIFETSTRGRSAGVILERELVAELVSSAVMAPTAGNSQPWKWYYDAGFLLLFAATQKGFRNSNRTPYVGLGGALELLDQYAESVGVRANIELVDDETVPTLTAIVSFSVPTAILVPTENNELEAGIELLIDNRYAGTRAPIEMEVLGAIVKSAEGVAGSAIDVRDKGSDVAAISAMIGIAEKVKLLYADSHHDFYNNEMRWSNEELELKRDGIELQDLCISGQEEIALKMIRSPEAARLIVDWKGGSALENIGKLSTITASAYVLVTMPESGIQDSVNGGRALARVWLAAVKNNVDVQAIYSPLQFLEILKTGVTGLLPDYLREELNRLQASFDAIFPEANQKGKIVLLKLSRAERKNRVPSRKPITKVLFFGKRVVVI